MAMESQAAAAEEEEQSRGSTAARANMGDLPESCVAHVLALTSPRDACRCAAVSPTFRDAAGSDAVWARFLPPDYRAITLLRGAPPQPSTAARSKKETYLGLADSAAVVMEDGGGGMALWLAKGSGGKCVALSARRLCLPWDDGELCWRWTPHPLSRFSEVAQLVDCTCLDIYAHLPAATLTPATAYAAYLVFATVDGHRGLSFPDQETTVSVGDHLTSRHNVCLRPDVAEVQRFMGLEGCGCDDVRVPTLRTDGWWEMEMGRLRTGDHAMARKEEEVVASFEVLGWYPKCGLVVEGVEFRPLCL